MSRDITYYDYICGFKMEESHRASELKKSVGLYGCFCAL